MNPKETQQLREQTVMFTNLAAAGWTPNVLKAKHRPESNVWPKTHAHSCQNKGGVGRKGRRLKRGVGPHPRVRI